MKKRRKTITPDIGIIADGKIFPLVKDELAKSVMRPMSDEEKDEFYPQLDGQPLKQSINDLGLCKYLDVLPLTTPDLKQEKKRIFDAASPADKREACTILCTCPEFLENPTPGYLCFLLGLFARFISYLPTSIVCISITVNCGDIDVAPEFLRVVLSAINGPVRLSGPGFSLLRPSSLFAYRIPGRHSFSVAPTDYIGGHLKIQGEKFLFWLPLWDRAVCVAPGMPPKAAQLILDSSPTVMPFCCNGIRLQRDLAINLPGSSLYGANSDGLTDLDWNAPLISILVEKFVKQTRKQVIRGDVLDSLDDFLPPVHVGRAVDGAYSAQDRVVAVSLCLYRHFLSYLRDHGWLSDFQCAEFLQKAQNAVLPPPVREDLFRYSDSVSIGNWNDPENFWRFLVEFITTNPESISRESPPYTAEVKGAVHTLRNSTEPLFILPRFIIESAYRGFCTGHGLGHDWSILDLTREIATWPVGLKQERDNSGWQYTFFREDSFPPACRSGKISCFGFPIRKLPSGIQSLLSECDSSKGADK